MPWKDPEKRRAHYYIYYPGYYEANRDRILKNKREAYHLLKKMRMEIIDRLGGQCKICGIVQKLEVDHIEGGGTAHRKTFPTYKEYLKFLLTLSQEELERDYQILCKPHNLEKYAKTGR